MSEKPIVNPSIPYVGPLQGNLAPGKFVRILGNASPVGKGFSCNLQSGLSSYDDIALQLSVRLEEGTIILNSQQHGGWGEAQTLSNLQINRGQPFEILVICEPTVYKIGINGQHLCEFPHKVPYYKATYIKIEGDLSISHISVESQPQAPPMDGTNSPPPPYPASMLQQNVPSQSPYPPAEPQHTAPSQPPYPIGFQQNLPSQSPYPVSGPQSVNAPPPYLVPGPQQAVPSQIPVPLNSAPQTIIYPSGYATSPMLQQQPNTAALNATPREYPFWQRSRASASPVLVPPEPSNSDVTGLINPLTGEIETVEQAKNIHKLSAAPSYPSTSTIPTKSSRQNSKSCANEMSMYEEEMLKLHKKHLEARMVNEKMIANKEMEILEIKKKAEEIRLKILEKDLLKKCNCKSA